MVLIFIQSDNFCLVGLPRYYTFYKIIDLVSLTLPSCCLFSSCLICFGPISFSSFWKNIRISLRFYIYLYCALFSIVLCSIFFFKISPEFTSLTYQRLPSNKGKPCYSVISNSALISPY